MSTATKRTPSIWTTGWTDILNTGTWRNAIAVHQKRPAPCHGACPVDGEIPSWVQQVRNGELHEAWLTLVENNPLPACIGRTCHHPCERGCNRGEYDGAITINALEQHVGDLAIREKWTLQRPEEFNGKRVAVIGGGPAGLSCAYQLRRRGFAVTIFDANPQLGGVLRYGVPQYRLPREVLAAEVQRILDLGVAAITGCRIGGERLEVLQRDFDAVFIAFGAPVPKRLPQFPREDDRVLDGLTFLRSLKEEQPVALGRRVVVIGGGSVAMDVAGSALRLGRQVKIIALEKRGEMPAPEDEVRDALDEGAQLIAGVMVKSADSIGKSLRLHCANAELDPGAPAGTVRPVEVKGTDFTVEADSVILAVGQDPQLADWMQSVRVERGMVVVDGEYQTSRPGVFAAGDVASTERFISTAVGDGKRAAWSIARSLGQVGGREGETPPAKEVSFADINTFYFPPRTRNERGKAPAGERKEDFREIRLGLAAEQVLAQAERCFSCGACLECNNCFHFCPDMAIVKDPESPLRYRVLDQYCKGCGCCLEECPRGAMGVKEETK